MNELRLPALAIQQGERRVLYAFAVDGKALQSFTTISRLKRDEGGSLAGYQRPEVVSHIAEIRNYLESDNPMVPNALVVAFDTRVRFEPDTAATVGTGYCRPGTLIIPIDERAPEVERPGWIVDGQQRAAAIREARIDAFPICVTAFIAETVMEQREQFILVNSTKPLPKGLIYELLPSTEARLSTLLERRRFPAHLVHRLNSDRDSPFKGLIDTPTNPDGTVKDNSLMRLIENSLSDGVLYRLRSGADDDTEARAMLPVLKAFWTAVADVFPRAWGQPPKRSRLMHGVGIVSLGFVMDAIADRHRAGPDLSFATFRTDLMLLDGVCRWTEGFWNFGPGMQRRWNELQNTSKDIHLLANHLLLNYRQLAIRPAAQAASDDQLLMAVS